MRVSEEKKHNNWQLRVSTNSVGMLFVSLPLLNF